MRAFVVVLALAAFAIAPGAVATGEIFFLHVVIDVSATHLTQHTSDTFVVPDTTPGLIISFDCSFLGTAHMTIDDTAWTYDCSPVAGGAHGTRLDPGEHHYVLDATGVGDGSFDMGTFTNG